MTYTEIRELFDKSPHYGVVGRTLQRLRNFTDSYLLDWQQADASKHGYFYHVSDILGAVYLILLISKHTLVMWVEANEVNRWKQQYLAFWDIERQRYEPEREEYLSACTKIIHGTFDSLIAFLVDKKLPQDDLMKQWSKEIFDDGGSIDLVGDIVRELIDVVQSNLYVFAFYPIEDDSWDFDVAMHKIIDAVYLINLIARKAEIFPVETEVVKHWKNQYLNYLDKPKYEHHKDLQSKRELIVQTFDYLIEYTESM